MSLLKSSFEQIPDPRRGQGKMYDLPNMLLFSVLAVASGANSYRRIHQFISVHLDRLKAAFNCQWKRAPAYTSVRYALQCLDAQEIETVFRCHAIRLEDKKTSCIAMDGKTLRGSLNHFEDKKAAQVLSALAVEDQLVLGHILIEDSSKDHEIQAAQRLIGELNLTGRVFTLDALHLQKNC
jgi:hypothetical protein